MNIHPDDMDLYDIDEDRYDCANERPHMDNADDLVCAITDAYHDDDTDAVRRLITARQTQMTAAALVLDVLDHLTHIDPTTDHHPNLRAILGSWR